MNPLPYFNITIDILIKEISKTQNDSLSIHEFHEIPNFNAIKAKITPFERVSKKKKEETERKDKRQKVSRHYNITCTHMPCAGGHV